MKVKEIIALLTEQDPEALVKILVHDEHLEKVVEVINDTNRAPFAYGAATGEVWITDGVVCG